MQNCQVSLQLLISVTALITAQRSINVKADECLPRESIDQEYVLQELRNGFSNPPNSAKPWVIWFWWNGILSEEEIGRELEEIADAGFGGAEIRCVTFNGWGGTALSQMDQATLIKLGHRRVEYLSDDFLKILETTCAKAKQLDLKLSINMGQGWPPGGPWIQHEHRSKLLKIDSEVLQGPTQYQLPSNSTSVDVYAWKLASAKSKQVIPGSFVNVLEQIKDHHTDDKLSWTVPSGQWLIGEFSVQMGGICDKGDGPEVDPGSREAILHHLEYFFGRVDPVLGRFYGNTLEDIASDSWEYSRGHSRYWSDSLPNYFSKLKGYDLQYKMYALIGFGPNEHAVLNDLEDAERGLVNENFFVTIANFLHERGLRHRSQPYGRGLSRDYFQAYAAVDIPEIEQGIILPEAAWVGRTLGRKTTSAEAFTFISKKHYPIRSQTGRYETTPWLLRGCSNFLYSEGINRLNWHSFSYSPPGLKQPGWRMYTEVHLNRNVPWWPYISTLTSWMSRIQYVLQAGSPVADALVYPIKSNPLEAPYGGNKEFQPVSASNCIDGANRHTLSAIRKRIESKTYDCQTLCLLEDISDRVEAENILAIAKHSKTLICCNSLPLDWQVSQDSETLSARITTGLLSNKEVIDARETGWRDALADVQRVRWQPQHHELRYQHRNIGCADIYFLANFGSDFEGTVAFPATHRRVEIWNAETGEMRAAPVGKSSSEQVSINIRLRHADSAIIAFVPGEWPVRATEFGDAHFRFTEDNTLLACMSQSGQHVVTLTDQSKKHFAVGVPHAISLNEPWDVQIHESLDLDNHLYDQIALDELVSWQEIPKLMNFAGTLSYKTSFEINHEMLAPNLIWSLDLGDVYEVAHVLINGEDAATILHPPYRADVTKLLKPGVNVLEVRVANLLKNYLASNSTYDRPSGMLGPVRLRPKVCVSVSDNN